MDGALLGVGTPHSYNAAVLNTGSHPVSTRPSASSSASKGGVPSAPSNPLSADAVQAAQKNGRFDRNECETCKSRKYQDGSDDPGVSFKTAAHIAPEAAASTVRGHEMEHVTRERAKAGREGREVVNQRVILHTGICPECGRPYVSGGTTYTTTRSGDADEVLQNLQQPSTEKQEA